jgi:DNA polymerase III epsilon subunit-like protein
MGMSVTNEPELIRLTAVNVFTSEILLDSLVHPTVPLKHYNTRYSGVRASDMHRAVRDGTCIFGRDNARALLGRLGVHPETIVVVHGGSSDFTALRWIHPHVVDTCLLEGYTGVKTEGGRSLKNLCELKLGIMVQQKNVNVPGGGGGASVRVGHDSLEDAMACRELALDWVRTIPDGTT